MIRNGFARLRCLALFYKFPDEPFVINQIAHHTGYSITTTGATCERLTYQLILRRDTMRLKEAQEYKQRLKGSGELPILTVTRNYHSPHYQFRLADKGRELFAKFPPKKGAVFNPLWTQDPRELLDYEIQVVPRQPMPQSPTLTNQEQQAPPAEGAVVGEPNQ